MTLYPASVYFFSPVQKCAIVASVMVIRRTLLGAACVSIPENVMLELAAGVVFGCFCVFSPGCRHFL